MPLAEPDGDDPDDSERQGSRRPVHIKLVRKKNVPVRYDVRLAAHGLAPSSGSIPSVNVTIDIPPVPNPFLDRPVQAQRNRIRRAQANGQQLVCR